MSKLRAHGFTFSVLNSCAPYMLNHLMPVVLLSNFSMRLYFSKIYAITSLLVLSSSQTLIDI